MNKYQSLFTYSILILITGISIFVFEFGPSQPIQYAVSMGMLASAFFAFITAYKTKNQQIPSKYHLVHGLGLAAYGLAVLFFSTSIPKFLNISALFLLYYGLTELIFGMQLLMMKDKLSFEILIIRLVLGFIIALGAVLNLGQSYNDQTLALMGTGTVLIICSINLLLFKTVLKKMDGAMQTI